MQASEPSAHPHPIALACSGIGHVRRGYERFFEDLADHLEGVRPYLLFSGARQGRPHERIVPCLRRTSWLGSLLVRWLGPQQAYEIEAWTFGVSLFGRLLGSGCRVVYLADYKAGRVLATLSRLLPRGRRLRILFHNGAPMQAKRLRWATLVQQLTRPMFETALSRGLTQSRLLPIPVDPSRFGAPSAKPIHRQLGLSGDETLLLCVGAHWPFKRLELAVRAVAQIDPALRQHRSVHLLIAGEEGPCTGDLHALCKQRLPDRVHFRSFDAAQMPEVYGAATLLLVPSQEEGFGIVLVEAMAAGVPIVAGDDDRKRSILGEAAVFVDAEDTKRFSQAISSLLEDRDFAQHLTSRAQRRVETHYSWDALLPEYLRFIDEGSAIGPAEGSREPKPSYSDPK